MLNIAFITLSNPAKPALAPVSTRAIVIEDEVGLVIPASVVQMLQLDYQGSRATRSADSESQHMPYAGPVMIKAGGALAYAGAIVCDSGIIVGKSLARELGIGQPATIAAAAPAIAAVATAPAAPQFSLKDFPEIMVIEDFIDADTCAMLCDYAASQQGRKIGMVNSKKSTKKKVETYVDTSARDTNYIAIDGVADMVNEIMFNIFRDKIEPFYKLSIEWWEKTQLLGYDKGGKYNTHADSENWNKDTRQWRKSLDRDISVLLYLNGDFTGGALSFKNQQIKIQPKPGLLVAFPSDHRYEHAAEPLESGHRFVLVSWARAKGVKRVCDNPPYGVTYMDEYRKKHAA